MSKQWFLPLAQQLAKDVATGKLKVLGISGGQGSGKSTLAKLLKNILEEEAKYKNSRLNIVALSLDDFYLTRRERVTLSKEIHPLLITRGVPGTHDTSLAIKTIDSLLSGNNQRSHSHLKIPKFDKARDDRLPENEWEQIKKPVDLIIFEGWCLGSEAQGIDELKAPINKLEEEEDPDAVWRRYVNYCLAEQYLRLWNKIDKLILLQIPSFDMVYQWRLNQEEKLARKFDLGETNIDLKNEKLKMMDSESIKHFIQHFERLTKHNLKNPPAADIIFKLNDKQIISERIDHIQ